MARSRKSQKNEQTLLCLNDKPHDWHIESAMQNMNYDDNGKEVGWNISNLYRCAICGQTKRDARVYPGEKKDIVNG